MLDDGAVAEFATYVGSEAYGAELVAYMASLPNDPLPPAFEPALLLRLFSGSEEDALPMDERLRNANYRLTQPPGSSLWERIAALEAATPVRGGGGSSWGLCLLWLVRGGLARVPDERRDDLVEVFHGCPAVICVRRSLEAILLDEGRGGVGGWGGGWCGMSSQEERLVHAIGTWRPMSSHSWGSRRAPPHRGSPTGCAGAVQPFHARPRPGQRRIGERGRSPGGR